MEIPRFDWKELFQNGFLHNIENPSTGTVYTLNKFLGQGGYGTVFRATSSQLHQDVAFKLMQLQTPKNEDDFLEETTAYRRFSRAPSCNLYIVCMLDAFTFFYQDELIGAIVTQLMDGDLDSIPTKDSEIPLLLKSLIDGLSYIHANGFAHSDLKPGNVLRKGKLFKIGDLGFVCDTEVPNIPTCSHIGTPIYSSPISVRTWGQEVSVQAEQKEDIWGLGMTLYVIIFGNFPPEIRTDQDVANLTQDVVNQFLNRNTPYPRSQPPEISGQNIIFLLSRMLKVDPNERWTIQDIRQYFNAHLHNKSPPRPRPIQPLLAAQRIKQPRPRIYPDIRKLLGLNDVILPNDIRADGLTVPDNGSDLDTAEVCRLIAMAIEYYQSDPKFSEEIMDALDEFLKEADLNMDYLSDCADMFADNLEVQRCQGTCGARQDQMQQMLDYLDSLQR